MGTNGPVKSSKLGDVRWRAGFGSFMPFCQCGKNSPTTRHITRSDTRQFPNANRHPRLLLFCEGKAGGRSGYRLLVNRLPGRSGFDGAGVRRYQVAS
jgi:hypothetical protein